MDVKRLIAKNRDRYRSFRSLPAVLVESHDGDLVETGRTTIDELSARKKYGWVIPDRKNARRHEDVGAVMKGSGLTRDLAYAALVLESEEVFFDGDLANPHELPIYVISPNSKGGK